jgi:hypothetical protein
MSGRRNGVARCRRLSSSVLLPRSVLVRRRRWRSRINGVEDGYVCTDERARELYYSYTMIHLNLHVRLTTCQRHQRPFWDQFFGTFPIAHHARSTSTYSQTNIPSAHPNACFIRLPNVLTTTQNRQHVSYTKQQKLDDRTRCTYYLQVSYSHASPPSVHGTGSISEPAPYALPLSAA